MLSKVHSWILTKANHKNATVVFIWLTFLESFISPIPPDIVMVPMIAANAFYLWYLPCIGAISSVLGGMIGYAIGFYFFQIFGANILDFYHMKSAFYKFQKTFSTYGFWMISLKGVMPIPFKIVAIAAGLARFDFLSFIIASLIGRFSRFYLLSFLIWFIGPKFSDYLKRFFPLFIIGSLLGILLGFGILKLFHNL